jgi:AsmA protein
MDFKIDSKDSRLNDFFTALPPEYVTWLRENESQGYAPLWHCHLKGQYIASQSKSPEFGLQYENSRWSN